MDKRKISQIFLAVCSLAGLSDAAYLSINYFTGQTPVCLLDGCDAVLSSPFATVSGIPISLFGVLFYVTVFILSFLSHRKFVKEDGEATFEDFWILGIRRGEKE